jgi:copper chaperone
MSDLRIYRVDGMTCEGCVRAVTIAIRGSDPAAFVQVDLRGGTVSVAGAATDDQVRQAIERAGYDYRGSA